MRQMYEVRYVNTPVGAYAFNNGRIVSCVLLQVPFLRRTRYTIITQQNKTKKMVIYFLIIVV